MSGSGNDGTPADTNYTYYKYINTPTELGMQPGYNLSNIADGVGGIISYIKLLVEGGSPASKTGGPLGNKYFYTTSQTCTDPDGNSQTLSLYVDNVPSGNLGIIPSGIGGNFSSFKGLLPGLLENAFSLAKIDFFSAFSSMDPPKCQQVTLQTIDVNNNVGTGTAYVSIDDIKNISPCNFVNNGNTNVVTGGTCEGFMVNDETRRRTRRGRRYRNRELKRLYEIENNDNDMNNDNNNYQNNYRNEGYNIIMPDDMFLKVFIISFGALWFYIALKLMANMYKKR